MASVDDRIVRMEFDNASFERKIGTTLTSLDKLDKSLKFDGAKKGLSDLSTQASRFSLGGIGDAVKGIADKFKTLSVIGIAALATIASKAVSAGINLAKSLTLDNIIAGFKEYEQNMGSIQTILANTKADGTNLKQVNAALDELNEYSDKTIYNFGQMTKNIGTFTAAGVDLDTSVQSIKGISNLAAISGSSAEQASTAMYQLSQAVASGTLKLQDWNSVVNAGMGGEVFQKSLWETGKAMGTLKDIPMEQTFEQWKEAGNSFRGSLQEGWITSEVLTTSLQGFTGEMTEAQLTAIGYTKEQAKEIMELGKTGVEAATKVRTLTGLIETTKESIGSGWSQSFRIVFGNFKEATKLFSGISSAVSEMVSKSADARNELLQGWKNLGGRTLLLESLQKTIKNLGRILAPIKEAFREVFPPMTSKRLFELTQGFADFAKALRPSKDTVNDLKRIFKGFFSILDLGWEVIKQGAKFIGNLFKSLTGVGSGNFLDFAAKVGDFFTELNDALVEGGGLTKFFRTLKNAIKNPLPFLEDLKDKIVEFFGSADSDIPDKVGDAFGRLGDRFESLKGIFKRVKEIWKPIQDAFEKVGEILQTAWENIRDFFKDLGKKIADTMGEGEFDEALDALNVGLLGGIAALLAKFIKDGFSFDIGGGFLDKIGQSFEELTGIMKAMQTDIKANALLKIAGAIGILTASVLVLSLIDSAALTKALTAMAVGFGQLMGAFVLLNKISIGPRSAAKFAALSVGMILLGGALLTLSFAVRSLAKLDWGELLRGLVGVAALLAILSIAVIPLSKNSSGMIRMGLGLIAIAFALNILAGAVKIFSMMSWGAMGKGMLAVAGGLLIIGTAMKLFPKGLALQGVGLLAIAISLNILAGALAIFGNMDWLTIGKGFVAIGGGLLLIGLAMKLFPPTMPLIGAGLLMVSVSLLAIGKAMAQMGGMSWGEIAKGLVAMAGSLLILAVACQAMQGAIVGAIAITIVSAAMLLLSKVLEAFAGMSWGDLLHGLIGIAAILATLAIAAMLIQPAIPALLALGAALLVIGAGMALFGFGASMVAKAFEIMAKSGAEGSKAIVEALKNIGKALPALVAGFAEGILDLAELLIVGLTELAPKLLELIGKLISGILDLIQEKYPEFVETGIGLLMSLLEGIRDNLPELVRVVADIITGFLDALTEKIPEVAQSVQDFLVTVLETAIITLNPQVIFFRVGVDLIKGLINGLKSMISTVKDWFSNAINAIVDFVKKLFGVASPSKKFMDIGIDLMKGLLNGIVKGAQAVYRWFSSIANKIVRWIGNVSRTLWDKGFNLIEGLLNGITKKAVAVTNWFIALPDRIFRWIGNVVRTLLSKGVDLISGLWDGISRRIVQVTNWFISLPDKIFNWVGGVLRLLVSKGRDIIEGMWTGISGRITSVTTWFQTLGSKILSWVGSVYSLLTSKGREIIQSLWNGMTGLWSSVTTWVGGLDDGIKNAIGYVGSLLYNVGRDIINGMWNGLKSLWDSVTGWISDKVNAIPGPIRKIMGIGSPSKVMMKIGEQIVEGLVYAFKNDTSIATSSEEMIKRSAGLFENSLNKITSSLGSIEEFNPVITPVLDLSQVARDAKDLSSYIPDSPTLAVAPAFSYQQARVIASTTTQQGDPVQAPAGAGEVKFEQNIYSPTQLSTSDIYKQTRNQITMAKQELSIP